MSTINKFRGRMLAPQCAAEALDSSECTVHRLIVAGKIKAVKIGYRMTRIDGDSLADFLESKLIAPGAVGEIPDNLRAKIEERKAHRASRMAA